MSASVDCEHHVLIDRVEDLLPYVEPGWRERIVQSEFRLPPVSPHPGLEVEGRRVTGAVDPADLTAALGDETTAAMLLPVQPLVTSGWLNHELSRVFAAAVNDHVVERWLPADPRVRFAISVPAHDGEIAAREIRRLGSHPGAAAVLLSPIRVNLGQVHYHPIYAAAAEHELPVIVHPGGFEGTVVGPAELGGVGPYTPEEIVALTPQVAMSNLSSLIFEGVFERFQTLRVVFAGFGVTWAAPLLWRADAEWRSLRPEVPWLRRAPSEYVREHVRLVVDGASETADPAQWRYAEMLAPEVLVWGSDAPFRSRSAAEALADAPPSLAEAITAGNARRTFPRLG